jgi:hypothetical protein
LDLESDGDALNQTDQEWTSPPGENDTYINQTVTSARTKKRPWRRRCWLRAVRGGRWRLLWDAHMAESWRRQEAGPSCILVWAAGETGLGAGTLQSPGCGVRGGREGGTGQRQRLVVKRWAFRVDQQSGYSLILI